MESKRPSGGRYSVIYVPLRKTKASMMGSLAGYLLKVGTTKGCPFYVRINEKQTHYKEKDNKGTHIFQI